MQLTWRGDAYMRQQTRPFLVQILACWLFNTMSLSIPSIRHESEDWGFESPSGRGIFCLKNFDTFTKTSVRVLKMNVVSRVQLTYLMLTLLKKINHSWVIVNWTIGNMFHWHLDQNAINVTAENEFDDIVYKLTVIYPASMCQGNHAMLICHQYLTAWCPAKTTPGRFEGLGPILNWRNKLLYS